jgi:PPIC-type PPIASE domain
LGLDRDDTVIRRRLRQKMEFLFNNRAAQAEPSDEQLRAWLSAYPDAFRVEPRFTFSQVYLNPQRRGAQLLAQLQHAGSLADVAALGDASLLEHAFEALPASAVAKQFGKQFTAQLGAVQTGQWHGPIASSYGAHLVFVSARTEGRLPALEEVRDAVRRDWANAQRLAANEQFYQTLLQRYTMTIERPQPAQGAETPHGTEARR